MRTDKVILAEKDLRRIIHSILSADSVQNESKIVREFFTPLPFLLYSDSGKEQELAGPGPSKPEILGKKFSYTDKGEPEGVVIASFDQKNVAKVYSKATVKDPVGAGKGRLLNIEELDDRSNWSFPEWFIKNPKLIQEPLEKIIEDNIESNPENIPNILYKNLGIFLVTSPIFRPSFGSTEGAIDAATQGKCSFGIRDFKKEFDRIFQLPPNSEERDVQILRVMNCAKAWTSDSFIYAIAQFVISLIVSAVGTPAAGIAVETAMDAIPGYALFGMYLMAGKRQTAIQLLITTTLACVTPTIAEKITLKFRISGWKTFLGILGGSAFLIWISKKVTTMMFGEDFGLTEREVDEWIKSQPDGSIQDLMASFPIDFKEISDIESLMRKIYPAL